MKLIKILTCLAIALVWFIPASAQVLNDCVRHLLELAHVVDRHDVGMGGAGQMLDLAGEPLAVPARLARDTISLPAGVVIVSVPAKP